MKKSLNKIFLLLLAAVMILSLAACGGTGDGTQDAGGDTTDITPPTGDSGDTSDMEDPENLVLIKDSKALFRIVLTGSVDASIRKTVETFIDGMSDIGVEIDDYVNDSNPADVSDVEVIVGAGVQNRDAKYAFNAKDYGEDGYIIKVVDNKLIIVGGTTEQTKVAFEYFVKSVVKLSEKTKDIEELVIKRDYERLKETKYLIDSVTVAGNDLSDYVFVTELAEKGSKYENIKSFRDDLYRATGYWLETASEDTVPEGKKMLSVKLTENAGESGFRAYVDSDGNLMVECAYSNAIDTAFKHLMKAQIFDKIGEVKIGKTFEKTYTVNVVYYSQFGAVGDGITEDYQAIYNAHVFANESGQTVMGDGKNSKYYIHAIKQTIPVKTDVDFNGSTFIIDDTGSEVFAQRSHIFTLVTDHKAVEYNASQLKAKFGNDLDLHFGDTEIPWLVGTIESTSMLIVVNNHRDYIRHGNNISSGQNRRDILIIEPDGKLHEDTPVIWDFVDGTQMLNNGLKLESVYTNAIEKLTVMRVDDRPITVKNGYFERTACRTVAETNYENKYQAYYRGIGIQRSNATVTEIVHKIVDEPEMPSSGWGYDTNGKLSQSYPYGGFLAFSSCYNSQAIKCDLNAHTLYYESKGSSANPVGMGSYDITFGSVTNIYLEKLTNGVDICDTQYWGIMCSNVVKNLDFKSCSLNRFDAHEGFWNASLIDCEYGHTINVIGGGYFYCENTVKVAGNTFLSLRVDYGSTFRGTMEFVNCTLKGMKTYRTKQSSDYGKYYDDDQIVTIVSSAYFDTYKGEYNASEAATFPYLKWDFGYTCYMPQDMIIDNFTFEHGTPVIFTNLGDPCFVKPTDFIQEKDYLGKTVDGRPMTVDDIYYNQYQITKSITFRNMNAIPVCADTASYLYNTLTSKVKVENS